MAEQLGQPVIVENRAGAGGSVGTTSVTREQPDGYTLLWGGTSSMVVAPALYPKLDYDPNASFTPIGMAVRGPLILVSRPALPSADLKALLDLARRQPLTVASAGTGSVGHLTAELFDRSANVDILHIPYRGGAPALSDVLGGQVDLLFDTVTLLYPQIAAQKLRAYAVTGAQRYPQLPNVPTVAWFGLMAPAHTPQPVIERLTKALAAAARDPEVKRQLADLGLEPVGDTPEQFAQSIRTDLDKWTQVVKQAGIKPD
jgi:tripartite-type tricarboxylate transporter receptor subunit TctC